MRTEGKNVMTINERFAEHMTNTGMMITERKSVEKMTTIENITVRGIKIKVTDLSHGD